MAKTGWLLIDGYNLLHASGVFGTSGRTSLERSREALLDWLGGTLSEKQRRRTTIVFDARGAPPGLPNSAERHGIQVCFSPRDREADDLLEELIQQHSSPRALTVISSDHRLHRAARRRKATPIDSERWVETVNAQPPYKESGPKQEVTLPPDELKQMLAEFRGEIGPNKQ